MLLERIYEEALPRLAHRKVVEVRIGRALLAVVLDNGQYGVAYTLPGELAGTPAPEPAALVGMQAADLARKLVEPKSTLERALGLAVCGAVAEPDPSLALEDPDAGATVPIRPTDTVGLIGFIPSLARRAEAESARLIVFDRSEKEGVYPEERQAELLPACDVVFITGSALTNGTLDQLLSWCTRARDVALIGPSTPLYPRAFAGSGVTVLAGATWPVANRERILEEIGRGACFRDIGSLTERRALRVPEQ